jgi:predicted transcriptional regulator
MPYVMPYTVSTMRKTSVYLDDALAERLARLAEQLGRSQAEIVREAIAAFGTPRASDRNFELAAGFRRVDGDARAVSAIPDEELLEGFGE